MVIRLGIEVGASAGTCQIAHRWPVVGMNGLTGCTLMPRGVRPLSRGDTIEGECSLGLRGAAYPETAKQASL